MPLSEQNQGIIASVKTPEQTSTPPPQCAPTPRAITVALNGASYFPMTVAASTNFGFDGIPWYVFVLAVAAGICYGATTNAGLERPRPSMGGIRTKIAAGSSLVAASAFYAGAYYGMIAMGAPSPLAETVAIIVFLLRAYFNFTGTLRFCNSSAGPWAQAFREGQTDEITRIIAAIAMGAFFCICTSDSLFAVLHHPVTDWFGVDPTNSSLIAASYAWTAFGTLAGIPLASFYLYLSLREELAFSIRPPAGEYHPDRYTSIGMLLALIMIFPALGAASTPDGQAITKLTGVEAAFWLKVIASGLYGFIATIIGTGPLSRRTLARLCASDTPAHSESTTPLLGQRASTQVNPALTFSPDELGGAKATVDSSGDAEETITGPSENV